MSEKTSKLAIRLAKIIFLLSEGKRLDSKLLAKECEVCTKTIQRDLKQRLEFLPWLEQGPIYYQLDLSKTALINIENIERLAHFASISDLFPEIDRDFYQQKLIESLTIKGFQYEDISGLQKEFNTIQLAIKNHQKLHFHYLKNSTKEHQFYEIAPYSLTNKNGIWYLIGMNNHNEQKTFCFTQISMIKILNETFIPDANFQAEIKNNDSIYHGNQLDEVVIQVSAKVAHYFLRRNLLPNQTLIHQYADGGLILSCKNVNEQEIVPIVKFWIPELTIMNPSSLQDTMVKQLKTYLEHNSGQKNDATEPNSL